jgi:hypothetical protein
MQDAGYISDALAAVGAETLAGSGFETAEPEPDFTDKEPARTESQAAGKE